MTALTIIVPVFNEALLIEASLHRLKDSLTHLKEPIEIIVVDGKSSDNSYTVIQSLINSFNLADNNRHNLAQHNWCVCSCPSGRAKQMNFAAKQANGHYLLFLHSDTQLPNNFSSWLHCLDVKKPFWGFFRLSFSDTERSLSQTELAWKYRLLCYLINLRSSVSKVSTGDQAQFFEREGFVVHNGFANLALMEDVEMSKRFRSMAKPFIWVQPVITSNRRWLEKGFIRTVLLMWGVRLAYVCGVTDKILVKMYRNVR